MWAFIREGARRRGWRENKKMERHTYLMLSVWVLYSMMVLGGRLRTRRRVSLMRAVVAWSLAVLFQMEIMSSWKQDAEKPCQSWRRVKTWNSFEPFLGFYLEAYWYHSPTNLLSNHELLAQHGQDQVLPAPRGQAFPQTDDPLPTHLIGIILNTRLLRLHMDFLFKQTDSRHH